MASRKQNKEQKLELCYSESSAESAVRLLTRSQAASYCNVSSATFSRWIAKGMLPPAIFNTNRWDRRAIDSALDRLSGIQTTKPNAFDQWFEEENARPSKRNSQGQEETR